MPYRIKDIRDGQTVFMTFSTDLSTMQPKWTANPELAYSFETFGAARVQAANIGGAPEAYGMTSYMMHEISIVHPEVDTYDALQAMKALGLKGRVAQGTRVWSADDVSRIIAHVQVTAKA